jgi:hypothetical protein
MNNKTRYASLLGPLAALILSHAAGAQTPPPPPDLSPRIASAAARIAGISQQADRIADYNELRNLQQIYGYYTDKALWDQVVDLFTDDGSIELGLNGVYAGKANIRKYLYSLTGGKPGLLKGQLNNTFQLSPVITITPDGQRAKARWRAMIEDGIYGSGSGGNWGAGTYENEYVKQDGVWKIRTLHLYVKFFAPYEGGWTRASEEASLRYGKSTVKPTHPTTVAYRPYPADFTPSFHYDNPARSAYRLLQPPTAPAADSAPKTVAELEAQVRALELKLERLKATDEVEKLENIYGFYADKSMQDAISALFSDNATLEILGRGVFIGRDRIYEYMRRLGAPTFGTLFNHMQVQPVVHVSADANTAKVRAHLLVMYGLNGKAAQWGDGIYENTFVKENGVWKYQNLMGTQTFYTNYNEGWGKHSAGMFAPFPGYPPDLPQSIAYDPYPAPFITPFHYLNPVSGK